MDEKILSQLYGDEEEIGNQQFEPPYYTIGILSFAGFLMFFLILILILTLILKHGS